MIEPAPITVVKSEVTAAFTNAASENATGKTDEFSAISIQWISLYSKSLLFFMQTFLLSIETTVRYVTGGGFEPSANVTEGLPTAAGVIGVGESSTETSTVGDVSESFPTLGSFTTNETGNLVSTSSFPTLASFEPATDLTAATVLANIETTNSSTSSGQSQPFSER